MLGRSKSADRSRMSFKGSDGKPIASSIGTESLDGNTEHIFTKTEIDHKRLISNQSSFSQIPITFARERADNGSLILCELCKIFQVRDARIHLFS